MLKTDKYRLSQTVYNILTNAYKFTNSKGKVLVSYQINQDNIVLVIEDNGSGISKQDLDKIFNAYYKNEKSMGQSGDGLGLYIAKENMKSIHGTISVVSEINQGSRFVLSFPRVIS
nr:ATP-binding protein [Mobilitalea sibirica]